MKRIRQGMLAAGMIVLLAGVAGAQVLQQVPGNAMVVVKVKDLKATSDKIAKLAQDLGVAAMAPQMADPLAALQAKTKMQAGLDLKGEMAFVFVDPATVGDDPEQAMLILVPVTDYQTFLGNWPDKKFDGDVSEITMGETPKPGYVTNWGSYAAIGSSKQIVMNKPTGGLTVPAVTSKEMASKDIVAYANFDMLRAKAMPALKDGRGKILSQVESGMKNEPQAAKFAPVIKVLVNQMMNGAEVFMNDTQAATLGVSLVPEGISSTLMTEFKPESTVAGIVTAAKNTDAPLLSGLPTGKYLIYGGGVSDPKTTAKLIDDITTPIVQELLAIGPEMKAVQEYVDALKAYSAAQTGQTFGMLAPSGAVGAEPLFQFISIQSGDPQAMAAAYAKMTQAQQDVMKALNVPGTEAVKPTLMPKAKTLDGVSFDSIVTKVDMNAQDPAAMQQAQVMNMIYGPQGAVVNYGVVEDKLLTVSGISDQLISSAIAGIKSKANPLADNDKVKAVAAQLPKERLAVVYVPVDDIVTTGLTYAKQFGFNMPVQLPPDLPPVGVTVSTEATAMRIDSHIPTTLVQSLVAAGMQAAMQMQGGGPRGGGL